MDNQIEKLGSFPNKPSFFSVPESFFLWARLGTRFWGGVLSGIGIGLFVASLLLELGLFKSIWTGFSAILLYGFGLGIAMRAVRKLG